MVGGWLEKDRKVSWSTFLQRWYQLRCFHIFLVKIWRCICANFEIHDPKRCGQVWNKASGQSRPAHCVGPSVIQSHVLWKGEGKTGRSLVWNEVSDQRTERKIISYQLRSVSSVLTKHQWDQTELKLGVPLAFDSRCLDTSGSMMGDRELLSKALVVECVRPCRVWKRCYKC